MTNPKAFLVTESEILDAATLAAYKPTVRAALTAAGGRPAVIDSIGGRINQVVSEWPNLPQSSRSAPRPTVLSGNTSWRCGHDDDRCGYPAGRVRPP
ncbi:MAG TPA: hypothetical protein VK630_18205 [Reyranella sp.]|nr:hypothetical protein [Reyranella sp.]